MRVRRNSGSAEWRSVGQNGRGERTLSGRRWAPAAGLATILLLGLILRVSYLREIVDRPDFSLPQVDACYDDYWARGIATGDWTVPKNLSDWVDPGIRSNPYLRPPAYPYFLAAVYRVFRGSYLAARIVQMVLGLVNCSLAYWLAKRVFGSAVGLIFALLMASYWALIYFEGELLAPVLLVTLTLTLLAVLSSWSHKVTFARGLAGGIVLGLFALGRANVLLFVPVVLGWSYWLAHRRGDRRRAARVGVGFVLGTVLTIAPATIRNWMVSKDFVLITANAGISLYTGNHEGASGSHAAGPELQELGANEDWTCFDYPKIVQGVARLRGKETGYADVSSYFVDKALDFVRRHPWQTLKLMAIKAALFWGPAEVSSNKAISVEKAASATLRHLPGFALPVSLALLGGLQVLSARRRSRKDNSPSSSLPKEQGELLVLVVLFVGAYFVSFLPFFVVGRYRIPVIPPLFLLGACGVHRIGRLFRDRKRRSVAGWLGAFVVLYAIASVPVVPYQADRAAWHLVRASCYRLAEKPHLAIQECQQALDFNPDSVKGHRRLADLLFFQRDYDGAARHYARAVELQPDYLIGRYNLAAALLEQRRFDDAITQLRWIVHRHPDHARAHYLLGRTLKATGQVDEAARCYRQALQWKPDYHQAHNNLANILMTQGRAEEAIRHYREALRIKPDYVTAQHNLANAIRRQDRRN